MGWKEDVEAAKRYVGQAPLGTARGNRNAAIVLSQHAGPGMKAITRSKLEDLARSSASDAETKRIALNALRGIRYPIPSDFYDC